MWKLSAAEISYTDPLGSLNTAFIVMFWYTTLFWVFVEIIVEFLWNSGRLFLPPYITISSRKQHIVIYDVRSTSQKNSGIPIVPDIRKILVFDS